MILSNRYFPDQDLGHKVLEGWSFRSCAVMTVSVLSPWDSTEILNILTYLMPYENRNVFNSTYLSKLCCYKMYVNVNGSTQVIHCHQKTQFSWYTPVSYSTIVVHIFDKSCINHLSTPPFECVCKNLGFCFVNVISRIVQ